MSKSPRWDLANDPAEQRHLSEPSGDRFVDD